MPKCENKAVGAVGHSGFVIVSSFFIRHSSFVRISSFVILLAALLTLSGDTIFTASAQSLWKDDSARSMVSDKRAHAVGDLLTILVQENNTASKDNSTKTSKSSGIDASLSSFLYSPAASKFPVPETASALTRSAGSLKP